MRFEKAFFGMLLCVFPILAYAQDVGDVDWKKIIVKEWNINVFINTNGGGFGFQHGRTPTYYDKHFWEIDLTYNFHHKAVLAKNPYFPQARAYSYGKLCDLFFLHGGYGYQRTLHQKPYWGGVRIRYTFSAGFTLGMAVPVFVDIAHYANDGRFTGKETVQYDPDKHNIDDIITRANLFQGIGKTKLRPGFYVKTGFNFDFSKDEYKIHALEVGGTFDMVFPFVQQMALNKAKPFYLGAYIAYHFGNRKAPHE